ncbi:MAG: SMC-Scp complex subunit ScpB [Pseudomonadota bacterium]
MHDKDTWDTHMAPPRLTLVKTGHETDPGRPDDGRTEAERAEAEAQAAAVVAVAEREADKARIAELVAGERRQKLRILEAALFAASEPLDEARLAAHLAGEEAIGELLAELQGQYAGRGVSLVRVAGKWAFRTADDLSYLLERYQSVERRLSKAALETLAIIAYHQPVTRAEVEEIRGVSTSAGTLDILLETGWVRPRGRRRAPGRPVTYGTTEAFLEHFGLDSIRDLPGLAELKGAGLLDSNLPPGFTVPEPTDVAALMPDELPLDAGDEEAAEEGATEPEPTLDLLDTDDNDKPEPSGA